MHNRAPEGAEKMLSLDHPDTGIGINKARNRRQILMSREAHSQYYLGCTYQSNQIEKCMNHTVRVCWNTNHSQSNWRSTMHQMPGIG